MQYRIEKNTVQETLLIPVYGRKMCTELYPNLYRDETAVRLFGEIDYDFSALEKKSRITGENHVTIAPKPGGDITFARASYWSICGNVTTSWERTENGYRLTVGIPANTTAEILLPDGTGRTVGAGQHRYEWK